MVDFLVVLAGFLLLVIGGEFLVRGSVAIAKRLGLSQLLIGLTLVGFGTSMPELATCVQASLAGSPGIAVGSFVGSNISNVLLIIGSAALLMPLVVQPRALYRDGLIVLLVSLLFVVLGQFLPLGVVVGFCFLALLFAYLVFVYFQETAHTTPGTWPEGERRVAADAVDPPLEGPGKPNIFVAMAMAVGGLLVIILGGHLLVRGAVGLALWLGVSETIVGLTVVAVGTSMPELVTSIIATIRRHTDVAVGNVLGSNLYNILGIGGAVGVIAPTTIPERVVHYDGYIMLAASAAMLFFALISNGTIRRWQGALLLIAYGVYLWSLLPPSATSSS